MQLAYSYVAGQIIDIIVSGSKTSVYRETLTLLKCEFYGTARFKLEARERITCVYFVTPIEYF